MPTNTKLALNPQDQLIARFRDGDEKAFNLIIAAWEQPIYNFVYRQLQHHEDTQDLVQQVFVRAYQKIGNLQDDSKFKSWLYSIALNLCRDEFRRRKKKHSVPFDDYGLEALNGLKNHGPDGEDPDNSAQADLHKKQVCRLIGQALELIPGEQREVVILKELQELKFTEIADVLNVPLSTVKSRMYYGLKALNKIFKRLNLDKEELYYEL